MNRVFILKPLIVLILILLHYILDAQSGRPNFSGGRGQSTQNRTTNLDSIQRPQLAIKYFRIHDLGYIESTNDTLAQRPLFTDLQVSGLHHLRLGNVFSATLPTDWHRSYSPGIRMGISSYDTYDGHFNPSLIASPNRPLAIAEFGTRFGDSHSNIGIQFNRTFARRITLGFHLFSGKSDGQFQNQESGYNRLDFNLIQLSKGGRRNSYAHFSIYRNREDMNGGLSDPTSIETPLIGGNINYSVKSNDAAFRLKNTNLKIGTSVRLGIDSIPKPYEKSVFAEIGSQAQGFNFNETTISDSDITRYSSLDLTEGTLDANVNNRNVYLKSGLRIKSKSLSLIGSLMAINNRIAQDSLMNDSGLQTFVNAEAQLKIKSKTALNFKGYLSVIGDSENLLVGTIQHNLKNHALTFSASLASDHPNVFQNRLSIGGTEQWNNDFANEKIMSVTAEYENQKWGTDFRVSYTNINDLIYFSRFATYGQFSDSYNIIRAELKQSLTLFNISLDNHILIQSVSNEEVLPLPKLSSRHDLSTQLNFFKKRLQTRFGCIVWLQDATSLPSFHPIVNDFYFPGSDTMNRYIRVLPYLRATIDTFEIFIAADDIINQAFNRNHFSVANYPELSSRINLGFRWKLLD